jgi:hypothetical protein
MDQDASVFSTDSIKLYIQEEGPTALNRIRSKVLGTGDTGTQNSSTASIPGSMPAS